MGNGHVVEKAKPFNFVVSSATIKKVLPWLLGAGLVGGGGGTGFVGFMGKHDSQIKALQDGQSKIEARLSSVEQKQDLLIELFRRRR